MSDAERTDASSSSPGEKRAGAPTPSAAETYEGSGGWGTAAMWLLITLFLLSAAATVHSMLATFGG